MITYTIHAGAKYTIIIILGVFFFESKHKKYHLQSTAAVSCSGDLTWYFYANDKINLIIMVSLISTAFTFKLD